MKLHHALLLIPALALASCGGSENPAPAENGETPVTPDTEIDLAVGAEYYATTCTPCHGATGKGDGAASANLVPKPRDLTDKEWKATIDDDYLRKIIQYGGSMVDKAPTMPPMSRPRTIDSGFRNSFASSMPTV